MIRFLLIVLLAGGLAGCNMVYSERPLFADRDARGAPPLRPGIWIKVKADCAVDPQAPAADLPECADPMNITAAALIPPPKKDGAEETKGPDRIPYILARGDPRIFQLQLELEKGKTVWLYQGLVPTRTDEAGRIVEARLWGAQCGPPPPKEAQKGPNARHVTDRPLPGLTIKESNCIARDQKAVRGAVKASEVWEEEPGMIRWMRDGPD